MLCFATRNSFSPLTGRDLVRTCALLGSSVVDAFAGADRVGAFLTALLYGDHSAKTFHAKLRLFPSEYSSTPLRPARARDRTCSLHSRFQESCSVAQIGGRIVLGLPSRLRLRMRLHRWQEWRGGRSITAGMEFSIRV